MNRIKSGISSLDTILGGGIPKGRSILLAGSCGTGKTILSQQFLFSGARDSGETGMYFSTSEPVKDLQENLEEFKFFDKGFLDEKKVRFIDLGEELRFHGVQNIQDLSDMIVDKVSECGATRIVLDSLTALCESLPAEGMKRDFILDLGYKLRPLGATSFMISETRPQRLEYSVSGVDEFIADGVILLSEVERKGDLLRTLQVIKMRGVSHTRAKHLLTIIDDGINLVPLFRADLEK